MGFFGRTGNAGCGNNDTILWFIILFLLLFWCGGNDGCCEN